MLRVIFFVLLLVAVLMGLAVYFLPWWLLLGAVVVGAVAAWLLQGRLFNFLLRRLLMIPFQLKGRVLRNATVEVHSIRRAAAPPEDAAETVTVGEEGETEPSRLPVPLDYYEVEATITPKPSDGPFMLWEAGELMLISPDRRWSDEDSSGVIRSLECWLAPGEQFDDEDDSPQPVPADGRYVKDTGCKLSGPRRLRLLVGVKPGIRELVFCYYLEQIGRLRIPVGTAAAANK